MRCARQGLVDATLLATIRARIGTELGGHWRLKLLLSAGLDSAVYLAAHDSGATHAIKVLHTARQKDARARFAQESALVPKIDHPSLVPILSSGVDPLGNPYFVMEFVEGWTFREMSLRGVWKLRDLLRALDQLLSALAAIHAAGIVHRDLKPENLLIDATGRLRLLDFGIAKDQESPLTEPGMILGTVSYMAPEQARGEQATPQSDVYAVGAIVFRVLTGRPVHVGDSAASRLWRTGTEPPPPIRDVDPELPTALAEWVMRALAFDASRRFADAAEMREALRRVGFALTPAEREKDLTHDAGEGEITLQRKALARSNPW